MFKLIAPLAFVVALPSFAAFAHEPGSPAFNYAIREYLLENPEILGEMQAALQEKQLELAAQAQAEALANDADRIFDSEHNIVLGNPDGDVTIVEFFDYNCGYCARAMRDMQAVIESDPNVRFVLKEFPILGPSSSEAHVVSMAIARTAPDKYSEFHQDLLTGGSEANGETAMAIAERLGVDMVALEQAMVPSENEDAFNEAYELATALQISGTPSYVVGDQVMFGAQGPDALLEQVKAAREAATN